MKKVLLAALAMAALSTAWRAPACTGYLIPKEAKLWKADEPDVPRAAERMATIRAVPKAELRWQAGLAVKLYQGGLSWESPAAGCRLEDAVQDKETGRALLFLLDQGINQTEFEKVWALPSELLAFPYDYPGEWQFQFGPSNLEAIWKAAQLALDEIKFKDFKPPEMPNQRIFNASFDATWSALIETMSDQRWQVESIDKGSGLITTKPARDKAGSTMACATDSDGGHVVFLNIFVKAVAEGSRVRINATFDATREGKAISCHSDGTLEREFFGGIAKSLAEAAPAK